MSVVIIGAPGPVFLDGNEQFVLSDATVTTNGAPSVYTGFGVKEVNLQINVTTAPTGTTPTLQFTLQEVDSGDQVTPVGPSVSSTVINSPGQQTISLFFTFGDAVQVTWTVGGTTPSFTGVYATLISKAASVAVPISESGTPFATSSNPFRIDPTGTTTQPVSATALPLPTGAATSANQTNGNQQTQIVEGGNTATVTAANALKVDGSAVTQPVSAASLPLPTGAATSANQTNGSQTTQIVEGGNTAAVTAASALKVDGSAVTQPVSGTVTAQQATAANLQVTATQGPAAALSGAWPTEITDGTHGPVTVTAASALKVDGSAVTQPVSGSVTVSGTVSSTQGTTPWTVAGDAASGSPVAGNPVLVAGSDGTDARTLSTDTSGHAIVVGGAATGAVPVGNPVLVAGSDGTDVRDISTDTSGRVNVNQGTAAALSGAWPIEITDGTHGPATVTAASALKVDGSAVTQPVSGTVSSTQGTTPWTVAGDAASGSPVAGNPVLVGGSDGTDARTLLTDTSGRSEIVGAAAAGAAVAGNPVLVGGSDGTDARTLATDTSGHPVIVGDGTAGSPAGGVVSVQGVSGGTVLPENLTQIGGTAVVTGGEAGSLGVGGLAATGAAVVGNPVLVAGSDGTDARTLATDTSGRQEMVGAAASGSAVAGNPVLVGGSDGTDARTLATDTSGHPIIVGDGTAGTPAGGIVSIQGVSGGTVVPENLSQIGGNAVVTGGTNGSLGVGGLAASGAALAGNPVLVAGSDGTDARTLSTDTSGHAIVVGGAATGAVPVGNPVLVAGFDGTDVRDISTDTSGRVHVDLATVAGTATVTGGVAGSQGVGGLAATGAAVAGNPVLVAGSDGTDARSILTDTSGRQEVVGAAAAGSAVAGNPVLMAGSDGTDARTLSTDTSGHAIIVGDGTAGTPAGGVVSIQGVAGGTNVPVSQGTTPWADNLTQVGGTNVVTGGVAGSQGVGGLAAPGAAVAGNPVLVGGTDGTDARSLLTDTSGRLVDSQYAGSYPAPGQQYPVDSVGPSIDGFGNLAVRGPVLTDEGSLRDDFTGTALTTALTGTVNWTNGSTAVTGSGTAFTTQISIGQYIKKTADSETDYVQVESVQSNTALTLVSNYAGTTAGAVSVVSNWATTTPPGTGSISVATSILTIASGVTVSGAGDVRSLGDYLPYSVQFYAAISQRIANSTFYMGLEDVVGAPNQQAVVQFTGTSNTTINFVTSYSTQASEIQTTAVTLPNAGVTSGYHLYKIDISQNETTLSIDGKVVAQNNLHVPSPYTILYVCAGSTNGATAPASTTSLTIDNIFWENVDRVQIDQDYPGEPMPVTFIDSYGTASLASASAALVINTNGCSTIAVDITGTYVGTITVQGQAGDGTWQNAQGWSTSLASLTATVTSEALFLIVPCGGYTQVQVVMSAYTSGTAVVTANASAGTNIIQTVPATSVANTYSCAIRSLSPTSADPTDLVTISGSATKTIRVLQILFSAIQTTAASQEIDIVKRSTANTGGTSTTGVAVPYDSNDAAATGVVRAYTVNPTALGTTVGNFWSTKIYIPAGGTTFSESFLFDFTTSGLTDGIVLRGTAQLLALNWGNGAALTTGLNLNVTIIWSEQ